MRKLKSPYRKATVKNAIIEFAKKNPEATAREIEAALGTGRYYIYEVLRKANSGLSPLHRRMSLLEQKVKILEGIVQRFIESRGKSA